MRKNTRAVRIGGVTVGGGNPVAVQSMLNVPIHDIAGNVAQAKRLEAEGCFTAAEGRKRENPLIRQRLNMNLFQDV